MLQWFQSRGKPCTATASRCESTHWPFILRMKLGSIGEIPPSTRVIRLASAETAVAAHFTMSPKIRHSGSSEKSQCEILLGSFQNITASTTILAPQHVLQIVLPRFPRLPSPQAIFASRADQPFHNPANSSVVFTQSTWESQSPSATMLRDAGLI